MISFPHRYLPRTQQPQTAFPASSQFSTSYGTGPLKTRSLQRSVSSFKCPTRRSYERLFLPTRPPRAAAMPHGRAAPAMTASLPAPASNRTPTRTTALVAIAVTRFHHRRRHPILASFGRARQSDQDRHHGASHSTLKPLRDPPYYHHHLNHTTPYAITDFAAALIPTNHSPVSRI